ncbi:uncharacterized protein LOC128734857 [Sabethes cyaneus]|uniref:uncharacterized protein LOC128734857 n=1 Tax=Sabethes cyaneus TaxID=53552 RepID=UPI00237EB4C5|nr:uncharacterized protein LOC128734857 [Sabethes cyaneus]
MEDDYDIYGDLDKFESQTDNKAIKELNTQIEELKEQQSEKEREKRELAKKNAILLENISSLLLTAKAELKRKDALIADVRRERDNTVFRRGNKNVRKHDQWTQTTLIRIDREVQTERREEQRNFKDSTLMTRRDRRRERSVSRQRELGRDRRQIRAKSRSVDVFIKPKPVNRWDGRSKAQQCSLDRNRERQRDRERRARRAIRTPELESSKHSAVRFRSPVRVKDKDVGVGQSESCNELTSTFIPMNQRELDRFVKEIGRKENRVPAGDITKEAERLSKKVSKKRTKLESSGDIIQSDEIGTTAQSGSGASNGSLEDLEQKLTALHGESTPKTPQIHSSVMQTSLELLDYLGKGCTPPPLPQLPPPVVPPPPEPSIIEQVPQYSPDEGPHLNDSRELRIVESDELIGTVEPAEPQIERLVVVESEIEDGELVSSDEEKVMQGVTHIVSNNNQEKTTQDGTDRKAGKDSKQKTNDAVIDKEKSGKSLSEERTFTAQQDSKFKSKDCKRRSRTLTEPSLGKGALSKQANHGDFVGSHLNHRTHDNNRKQKALKDLFGSDDENSLGDVEIRKRRNSIEWNGSEPDRKRQKRATTSGEAKVVEVQIPLVKISLDKKMVRQESPTERKADFSNGKRSIYSVAQPGEKQALLREDHASQTKASKKDGKIRHEESTQCKENGPKSRHDHGQREKNVASSTIHNEKVAHQRHSESNKCDGKESIGELRMIAKRRMSAKVENREPAGKDKPERRKSLHHDFNHFEKYAQEKVRKSIFDAPEIQCEKETESRHLLASVNKLDNVIETVTENKNIKQTDPRKRRRSRCDDFTGMQYETERLAEQKVVNNCTENKSAQNEKAKQERKSRSREPSASATEEQDTQQLTGRHAMITRRRKSILEENCLRYREESAERITEKHEVSPKQKPESQSMLAEVKKPKNTKEPVVERQTARHDATGKLERSEKNNDSNASELVQPVETVDLTDVAELEKSTVQETEIVAEPTEENSCEFKQDERLLQQPANNQEISQPTDPIQEKCSVEEAVIQEEQVDEQTPMQPKEDDRLSSTCMTPDGQSELQAELAPSTIATVENESLPHAGPHDSPVEQSDSTDLNAPDRTPSDKADTSVSVSESSATKQDTSFTGRFSEYRIAFDNEIETTVIITRKKKKKIKSKNTSL